MKVKITYGGYWSEPERANVRQTLTSAGFEVEGHEEVLKGGGAALVQLILDFARFAEDTPWLGPALFAVALLADGLHGRKDASIEVRAPTRRYHVPVDASVAPDVHREAVSAIRADFEDDDRTRSGDMAWWEESWYTVDELAERKGR